MISFRALSNIVNELRAASEAIRGYEFCVDTSEFIHIASKRRRYCKGDVAVVSSSLSEFHGQQVEILEDQDDVFGDGTVLVSLSGKEFKIDTELLTFRYMNFAGLDLLLESSGPRPCTRCGEFGHEAYPGKADSKPCPKHIRSVIDEPCKMCGRMEGEIESYFEYITHLSGTPREKLDTRFKGNFYCYECRRERREQRRNKEHEDAIFAAPINHDEYEEEQEEGNGTTTDSSTKVDDSAMAFFKQCYNQRQFRR